MAVVRASAKLAMLQDPSQGLQRAVEMRCGQRLLCVCHFTDAGILGKEIFGIAVILDYK